MNPRSTGLLLLVAVALGAFVYFYEIGGESGRQEAEERSRQLFPDVGEADIQEIALETSDGVAARLERAAGGWQLTEPLVFPADDLAADALASNLAGLASEAELEDPESPEEYGLGETARQVRFRAGGDEQTLRLGNPTPIGSNAYALVEGDEQIYMVQAFEANSFEKSLADLRERRILEFDRDAIERIEARWPGGSVVLERVAPAAAGDESGSDDPEQPSDPSWRVVAPVAAVADVETVEQLLSDLSFLRADAFVDDPPDDAAAGLEPPAFEVILTSATEQGGEPLSQRIAIGEIREGEQRWVRSGHPSLSVIAANRLEGFPRQVVEYRQRTLASFSPSEAQQVDFFFQPRVGDPVVVTSLREGGTWSSSPEALATGKLERLVAELSRLKAADIHAESAEQADLLELELSPPNTIITVFGPAEDEDPDTEDEQPGDPPQRARLAEIQIGRVVDSEWIIARAVGDPAIYRLDYELAEHLPVSLDALRNRFVEAAAPDDAAAAELGETSPEFLLPREESP